MQLQGRGNGVILNWRIVFPLTSLTQPYFMPVLSRDLDFHHILSSLYVFQYFEVHVLGLWQIILIKFFLRIKARTSFFMLLSRLFMTLIFYFFTGNRLNLWKRMKCVDIATKLKMKEIKIVNEYLYFFVI